MDTAVKVNSLQVRRQGRVVLDGVSCEVEAGRVVGLLGPSGAGKTTMMRCMVGVQRISSGNVMVLGRPAGSAALRKEIGYMTQSPAVYADLSVRENLRYFGSVLGVAKGRVDEAIELVSLGAYASTLVDHLSGGQRARVSLGVALLGKPRLLVLDEPTVGLDPLLRRDLWGQFQKLADDGATLVISSHVMDEAAHCQELLLMRDGRLIFQGTSATLLEKTGTGSIEDGFVHLVEEAK